MSDRKEELVEKVIDAWDAMPRLVRHQIWEDPALSDLYWSMARLSAYRQAMLEIGLELRKRGA